MGKLLLIFLLFSANVFADNQEECARIRSDIVRQQNIANMAPRMVNNPMFVASLQAKSANNIADLESQAATLNCNAAFSSNTVIEQKQGFSQACFDTCINNTTKTKDQCFDACNSK